VPAERPVNGRRVSLRTINNRSPLVGEPKFGEPKVRQILVRGPRAAASKKLLSNALRQNSAIDRCFNGRAFREFS
jgi:hypothetical protein